MKFPGIIKSVCQNETEKFSYYMSYVIYYNVSENKGRIDPLNDLSQRLTGPFNKEQIMAYLKVFLSHEKDKLVTSKESLYKIKGASGGLLEDLNIFQLMIALDPDEMWECVKNTLSKNELLSLLITPHVLSLIPNSDNNVNILSDSDDSSDDSEDEAMNNDEQRPSLQM